MAEDKTLRLLIGIILLLTGISGFFMSSGIIGFGGYGMMGMMYGYGFYNFFSVFGLLISIGIIKTKRGLRINEK